ncbi:MAG: TetR/AcrR family transcriptional regulator [Rhodocyclaceae bacterium]|nr:TetR/AcrR family transcriptional regulator [Rhodocyclaceae bacterium]
MNFATLPRGFHFDAFRRISPVNEDCLLDTIFARTPHHISVKRRAPALANLQKIFSATFCLANQRGFGAMNLRDLCRESGLSMGGLYGYLQSKDQLSAMIEDVIRYLCEQLPGWFDHISDTTDQVEAILRAHIYLSEMLHPWFFFVYLEARTVPTAQRKQAIAAELAIESHLARLLGQESRLSNAQDRLLAAHAMALIQDWHLKRWKYRREKISIDAFADSVIALVRARLTGA